jgi:hypothetical protein
MNEQRKLGSIWGASIGAGTVCITTGIMTGELFPFFWGILWTAVGMLGLVALDPGMDENSTRRGSDY